MSETPPPAAGAGGPATKPPNAKTQGDDEGGAPLLSVHSPVFNDVIVTLQAKLGDASMSVKELLALQTGSTVTLDRKISDPADIYLNQVLVGRGEIVAVDDQFGIRIVEIARQ